MKGSHNIQAGGAWTRTDVWLQNQQYVPTMNFGIDGADPANGMFTTANFSGASTAQLTEARDLYAVLTGRVNSITGELRLDENTDEYQYLGLGMQRARLGTTASSSPTPGAWKPNFTVNLGLRYELQLPFYPRNNSYSKATIDDVCGGRCGAAACNLFQPGVLTGQPPAVHPVQRGRGRVQHRPEQLRAERRLRVDARRQGGVPRDVARRREATACCGPATRSATTVRACPTSPAAIDDNPGVSHTANRNARARQSRHAGIDLPPQPCGRSARRPTCR